MPLVNMNVWKVPVSPGSTHNVFLRDLVLGQGVVYYSKYIVDVFGELDGSNNTVREWPAPSSLWAVPGSPYPVPSGVLQGICLGPNETLWGALLEAGRLVTLDLKTDYMRCYGKGVPQFDTYPFSSPRRVKTDGAGRVWYIGTGVRQGHVQGQLIGYLDPKTAMVTYWELQSVSGLMMPWDLFVDQSGEVVWFTLYVPYASMRPAMATVPFLVRLDVARNKIKWWSRPQPPQAGFGGARGIAADAPSSPKNLWLTYEDGWGKRVLRHEVNTGRFYEYENPRPGWYPREVALSRKTPWFSDESQMLSGKLKVKACELYVKPIHDSKDLSPITDSVPVTPARIKPIPSSATLQPIQVTSIPSACGFVDVPCPGAFDPEHVVIDSARMLFFQQASGDQIGAFQV